MTSHRPRKRFGQHFLHDAGVLERIVRAVAPGASDHIVEIGPGEGALTRLLLPGVDRLDTVELDRDLAAALPERLGYPEHLHVHSTDALKFDFRALAGPDGIRVVGNLPYNISTPLLFHLFDQADVISDMHFMMQKEVVDRLTARPGGKQYGRLTVMSQSRCEMWKLFEIGPGAFTPPPKVDSAVIRLRPLPPDAGTRALYPDLERITRLAFGQRRKTIRNSLKTVLSAPDLERLGIEPSSRPENLEITEFHRLAAWMRDQK